MNRNMEERLPQVVEERLQEAYEAIRRGEIKQMKHTEKQKRRYRRWTAIAASLAILVTVPSVVYAAVTYFQKSEQREADKITYEFALNYELVPGEYQVVSNYLPEGMVDGGHGKYYGEDDSWITVMPIYTMAELEKVDGQIVVEDIAQVEHMELSGMEADVITFQEAEKYRSSTYIFLFNERDGYVLNVIAGYLVEKEELLKFADNLSVERTGDGSYETKEDADLRKKEEESARELESEAFQNQAELVSIGIPQDKIYAIGEELSTYDGAYGYTVTGYEFLDGIAGFAEEDFFDYTRFNGWLNDDKTLRPYTRQHYDQNGQLLAEEKAAQQILRVDIEVHCYDDWWNGLPLEDVALDFQLDYVEKKRDGAYTWAEDYYTSIPSEDYELQMDNSAVYLNQAVHTQGEERKSFFYAAIEKGETLSYTLLFVVDTDRREDFLLSPAGSNNSRWQCESMTAEECRDELDGYIQLK